MRKILIQDVPVELITEKDLSSLITKFMKDKYLVDKNNLHPLVTCTMNHVDKTATIELSSVEETNRLLKLAHIRIFEKDCNFLYQ